MAAFTLTADQKVTLSINAVDAYGNAASIDGAPVWTTSDPTKLTVTAAPDGMSAVVEAVGPVGSGLQIVVTGDADLGEGVREITAIQEFTVIGGEAATFGIVTGTAESKA